MTRPLSLFEGYGIEIESMIVDAESFDVRPISDQVLRAASGADEWVEDHDDGPIAWSNELVCHLIELKTNGPVASFQGVAAAFERSVANLERLLAEHGARVLPSGMHPWMDPARETRLWPHDHGPVYAAYDRLFDCRRHGWANVQAVHLNLPFADEREFARLMAATRLVLPLLPGIAAASPFVEGRNTGLLDNRLDFYRTNSARIPSMTGDVIPEPIYGFEAYRSEVLGAIDAELRSAGADEALLGQEWTNARGAIARFDRMAVEIRLLDAQECPRADLAMAAAVAGLVRALVEERWSSFEAQSAWPSEPLAELLMHATATGPRTKLEDPAYLALFGRDPERAPTVGALWGALAEETFAGPPELAAKLELVLQKGTLAQRLLAAVGTRPTRERFQRVLAELAECPASGRSFLT